MRNCPQRGCVAGTINPEQERFPMEMNAILMLVGVAGGMLAILNLWWDKGR